MKKLTAGIFATILGVTAMGAADAAVTSKGYVDQAVKTVAQSVTDLGTNVSNTYATKQALETAEGTLQGNIDTLAGKVYTKTETDGFLGGKADKSIVGALPEGKTVVGYVDEKIAGVDAAGLQEEIAKKANSEDVYTKTAADAAFATAAQGTTADETAAKVATYGDIVTRDAADFATLAALQGEEEARTEMDANLQAEIEAIESGIGGIATAGEGTDGLYALTKNVTTNAEGQQVVTYVWEKIDRDYASDDVTDNGQ